MRSLMNAEERIRKAVQEVAMSKLQRMKKKYPTAYKQFVKKMGVKQANELFRHVVEEKN